MKEYTDYSLLTHNTFGMDVKAKRYVEYDSEEELATLIPTLSGEVFHIGGGSNLLFKGDFDGTILHSAVRGIEVVDETPTEVLVRVGAGEVWDDFVAWAVSNGY